MGLAQALLDQFGQEVEQLTLIPSYGGAFEVTIGGQLVYSKKQTGRHPTVDEIKKALRQRLAS